MRERLLQSHRNSNLRAVCSVYMEKRTLVSSPTNTKQGYKTALHIKPPKQVVGGTMLNKNGPVPDLSGNAFRFSLRMFAMGFLFIAFIMSGKVPSLTTFWSVFSVCVKAFSVSESHVKHKEQQRSVGCFPQPRSAWRFWFTHHMYFG